MIDRRDPPITERPDIKPGPQKPRRTSMNEDLKKIGEKIGFVYSLIEPIINTINQNELNKFQNYLNTQDAIAPIFNPTYYRNQGIKEIEIARERVSLLKKLKENKWKIERHKD
jgi:hypothetical protein